LNLRLKRNNMGSRWNKVWFFFFIFQVYLDQTILSRPFLFCLWALLYFFTFVEWLFRLGWLGRFCVCVDGGLLFWGKFWFFHATSSWVLGKLFIEIL
jgi:hypothetical protein